MLAGHLQVFLAARTPHEEPFAAGLHPRYAHASPRRRAAGHAFRSKRALDRRQLADRPPSSRRVIADHNVQDHSPENRKKYADIKTFAKRHGVDFYPAGRGAAAAAAAAFAVLLRAGRLRA